MRSVLLMVLMLCAVGFGVSGDPYGGGAGTAESPWEIDTTAQFETIATADEDWADYFIQTTDLDFVAAGEVAAIATEAAKFSGQYDGAGYTISNIDIDDDEGVTTNAFGLWAYMQAGGVIKNLTVINADGAGQIANVAAKNSYSGILVGENAGTIENCYVQGDIVFTHSVASTYGIVGIIAGANHGRIQNCSAGGSIVFAATTGTVLRVGGVAGYQSGTASATESYCKNIISTTHLSCNSDVENLVVHVGGVTGGTDRTNEEATYNYIENCFWNGRMSIINTNNNAATSNTMAIGGIVGYNESKIHKCGATGYIEVTQVLDYADADRNYNGGAIGQNVSGAIASESFGNVHFRGSYADSMVYGGFTGFETASTISDCYAIGSIYDIIETSTVLNLTQASGFIGIKSGSAVVTNCWSAVGPFSDKAAGGVTYGWGRCTGTPSGNFYDDTLAADVSASTGATGKTTEEMMTRSTFSAYESSKWAFPSLGAFLIYPKLQIENYGATGGGGSLGPVRSRY